LFELRTTQTRVHAASAFAVFAEEFERLADRADSWRSPSDLPDL